MMKRSELNPILTRKDIPDIPPDVVDVSSVFNPGAIFFEGQYVLLLRVQTRGRETVLMVARSSDGAHFNVSPEIVKIDGIEATREKIYHIYDPRLTKIDNTVYVVFTADTDFGCHPGIAKTQDFKAFELVSFSDEDDSRNSVLFPEKINDRYLRLERPNRKKLESGPFTGSDIVLAESDDLISWREVRQVMSGRYHFWDELIGSGPPPVKTREGWLHIYHGIATHFASVNIYQAGAVLLDLNDPAIVLKRSKNNILEPRELYELTGQVPNVVFPSGMIVEEYDDEGYAVPHSVVRVYYGAADTVVALATTTVQELIDYCILNEING